MRWRTAVAVVFMLVPVACAPAPHEELEPLSAGGGRSSTTSDRSSAGEVPVTTVDPGSPIAEVALDLAAWPAPSIELLDRGAEPHRKLRFAPQPGAELALRTVMSMDHSASAGPIREAVHIPGVEIDHHATVRAVADDQFIVDDRFVDYTIPQSASMDRVSLAYLREEMNQSLGTSERTAARPDGSTLYVAQLNPSGTIKERYEPDSAYPLPDEPVGVGARWNLRAAVVWDEMPLDLFATIEITEIHDDRVVARFESLLTPSPDFSEPGIELVSGDFQGSGTLTWVLWAGVILTDQETTSRFVLRETRGSRSLDAVVEQRLSIRTTTR
jgi:hypothetical protein